MNTEVKDAIKGLFSATTMARTIITIHVAPPIPVRHFDWCATFADAAETGPTGWGRAEEEAIADLRENCEADQ